MATKADVIKHVRKAINRHEYPLVKQLETDIAAGNKDLCNQISGDIALLQAAENDVVAVLESLLPDDDA